MFQPLLAVTVPDFRDSIKGKLRDLGWTDAVSSADHEYGFLLLPEVRKPEPLTPTGE